MPFHDRMAALGKEGRLQLGRSSKADKPIVNDSDIPLTLTSIQRNHSAVEGAEVPVQRSEQQPDDQYRLHNLVWILERLRYNVLPEDPSGNLPQSPCPPSEASILEESHARTHRAMFQSADSENTFVQKVAQSVALNESGIAASSAKHREKRLEYTNKTRLRKQNRR
ncbi:hypothetical protein M436DRAFT_65393 [Aureobasidium namibiae CBS 147.97]|uniref:Uncharacterized protein n=1 Tax=Aureobasidium namibiae CBS 147.97 TaxID=1043004 RepID=A0A074X9D8_9PEZI|nr:uncharacterized protein M436DRAFT_65393 [Aureobasidium namibiae CBS 147.97]KEQ71236.1 hypothetical protein M436DRAFT_65393 [Aureobasidium namibiae CBS 147.97]